MSKLAWIKKKSKGCVWEILGAVLQTIFFCLTAFWLFHFETWTERLIAIVATFACYYVIGTLIDKFSSEE
ncbi:hypothetical protein CYR55_22540 [Chimaeribacter californicus]|uniref:Uncharacterized protein n=1 Tax=Chimaeribacter californicus TaxID=2060067 RepID=A0A2N5DTM6_9GAMM|nr:hypothetical protein [Chimaeribacter californicus]PLR29927.1 hypothetical protein CYR55_22540 [Chimaeribacter californicus]